MKLRRKEERVSVLSSHGVTFSVTRRHVLFTVKPGQILTIAGDTKDFKHVSNGYLRVIYEQDGKRKVGWIKISDVRRVSQQLVSRRNHSRPKNRWWERPVILPGKTIIKKLEGFIL